MKFLVVLLVVAQLTLGENGRFSRQAPRKLMKGKLVEISSCIRGLVLKGDESVRLPVLDPAIIEQKTINFKGGKITIKDFRIEGLSGWKFPVVKDTLKLIPPRVILYVTALWPEVSIETDYDADLPLGNGTVKAEGHASLVLKHLSFATETDIRRGYKIKSFKIKPHLGSITFEVNDVNLNLRERSSLSGPALARLVGEYEDAFNEHLSRHIMDSLNDSFDDSYIKRRGLPINDRIQAIIKRFSKCIK